MRIEYVLKKYNNIEIELLLAHVLKKPKEFLYMFPAHRLTRIQTDRLTRMVKRRLAGEPVAYILGYKDFCGLRFVVNKDVLVPRPESEWLVERVRSIQKTEYSRQKIRILDLGTGSGAIIISLAKLLSPKPLALSPLLVATDISSAALKVAKKNAKFHKVKVNFVQSDLFKNTKGKFDVIVANLPYVPIRMLNKYMRNVKELTLDDPFAGLKYEPLTALTDGTPSFQIYRRFFEQVGGYINKNGLILLEIDPSAKKFLIEYQEKFLPSAKMKFHRDYNKLLRYAEIKV